MSKPKKKKRKNPNLIVCGRCGNSKVKGILSLYPEDFEKSSTWFDVCAVLGISQASESANITFTKVTNT